MNSLEVSTSADHSMNVLEFIAAMTKDLAWPLVVLAIALWTLISLRAPITRLIDRIKKLSYGETAAEFDNLAQDVKGTVASITATAHTRLRGVGMAAQATVTEAPAPSPTHTNIGKIICAWTEIEDIVRSRLSAQKVDHEKLHGQQLLLAARVKNLITQEQYDSLRGLFTMRNLAAHGRAEEITEQRVNEYIVLAEAIKTVLDMTRPKAE